MLQVVDSILQPPVGDLRGVLVNSGHSLTRFTTLLTVVGSFDEGIANNFAVFSCLQLFWA